MTDLTIFIASAGPVVMKANLIETIFSIAKNIGDFDYKFYIVVDKPEMENFVKDIFENKNLKQYINENSLLDVVYTKDSWATDYNAFFEKYKNSTRYVLISHDDIIMHTSNFFGKTLEEIKGKEDEIGWVVYTNDRYYDLPTGPMPNSFGTGFHPDVDNEPFVFECHKFTHDQQLSDKNKHLLDLPERAVKCHGPYDLMIVSTKAMEKIGPCAYFGPYTMLIDEDWALESLKQNLINIWIPTVRITHPNPKNIRNSVHDLRGEQTAHRLFHAKWGFQAHRDYVIPEKRKEILDKYKHTNIPWSASRKSYEWDYLK